ncbi:MAG: phosphoribosylformylglycinamidine synthase, purS protein [Bacteroidetes bacterium GWA2_32_17]|nr:MAG: phosphoribosylformylglycinamidine synthase, purS protein [Bacteroidetes bacterium GWA2_32_17]
MKFIAEINVMPLKALLDPQGKAVLQSMNNNGYKTTSDVRIGKHITIEFEAASNKEAEKIIDDACKKMLTNPIMESFEFNVKQIK